MDYSPGLEGVVVGETAISNVEGDIGRLTYRGHAIEDLVELPYLAVAWLLLFAELPSEQQQAELQGYLEKHGRLHETEIALLDNLPLDLHPMRMLQGMIPLLQLDSSDCFHGLDEAGSLGLQIVARLPSLITHFHRAKSNVEDGLEGGQSDHVQQSYLKNFLSMFTGQAAPDEHLRVLNVVQILQMEHSFNAGTFACRVVASTLAPVDSVLSAGVGTLFGKLHGGADEAALNDAMAVASPENAAAFIDELFAKKGKLMGMGHREYRKVDPRSVILKPLAEQLCMGTEHEVVYQTLVALETAFNHRMQLKGKEVWANLEFYKGAVYTAMGVPANYFTALFAMSRAVGWLAHFNESRLNNRIMRPKAKYTGL